MDSSFFISVSPKTTFSREMVKVPIFSEEKGEIPCALEIRVGGSVFIFGEV